MSHERNLLFIYLYIYLSIFLNLIQPGGFEASQNFIVE